MCIKMSQALKSEGHSYPKCQWTLYAKGSRFIPTGDTKTHKNGKNRNHTTEKCQLGHHFIRANLQLLSEVQKQLTVNYKAEAKRDFQLWGMNVLTRFKHIIKDI